MLRAGRQEFSGLRIHKVGLGCLSRLFGADCALISHLSLLRLVQHFPTGCACHWHFCANGCHALSHTDDNMNYEMFPLDIAKKVQRNNSEVELIEFAVCRAEGRLASTGAFVVETGVHTGRSPNDKFTVRDATTESTLWWDNNKAMTAAQFDLLFEDFKAHAATRELFVQDLHAGADPANKLNARIFCELAWHAVFIRNMLRRPDLPCLVNFAPEFTVVNLPSFRADPVRHGSRTETVIACDFTRRIVLIGGSSYAGETKKSVFSFLNFLLPSKGVLPMTARLTSARQATQLCSSGFPEPARPRCLPIQSVSSSATTSTAGPTTAFSISKGGATRKRSGYRRKLSQRFGKPPIALARSSKTSSSTKLLGNRISTMGV